MYLPDFSHEGLTQFVKLVGYPGLIGAVFFESGVFFGFFLPGSSMLFTAGLLASQGYFNVWILLPLVTLAAILGDSTGYWFGNKVGVSLFFKKDSRLFKHEHLERAKDFYDRHGMQAVMLARFIPIIRTFAPIIAGIVNMRYRVFLTYNVIGGVLWATGVTFSGYFLGAKIPGISDYITPIILAIIIVSFIPLFWHSIRSRFVTPSL
jgi:membrane-associated protein